MEVFPVDRSEVVGGFGRYTFLWECDVSCYGEVVSCRWPDRGVDLASDYQVVDVFCTPDVVGARVLLGDHVLEGGLALR